MEASFRMIVHAVKILLKKLAKIRLAQTTSHMNLMTENAVSLSVFKSHPIDTAIIDELIYRTTS